MGGMPDAALRHAALTGSDPVLPSSFAVGTASQATVAAAALAACELGHDRGAARQQVSVDMRHAALEFIAWFSIDGRVPPTWDPFSGIYRCKDGWVRVHANFAHHRDGALRLLGLDPATATRTDAEHLLLGWRAVDYEDAAAERGLVVTAARTFAQWDAHPQGVAVAAQPLMTFERMGDAPPIDLCPLGDDERPLSGVRVLDLTRILAGPTCGRALAAYGADVMLVNSPNLPNIELIAATSAGKLSTHADLLTTEGRAALRALLSKAHVFLQSYRPGGLASLGFGAEELARERPGLVYVSLTAYGTQGPWNGRRGFDSLVQTAMGFNLAEAEAAGAAAPKAMPSFILDCATGFLMAFAVSAALRRQRREGGSWHVRLSLAQTGHWLRSLGRVAGGMHVDKPDLSAYVERHASGWGELATVRHSAELERTPALQTRPAMPPGSHAPAWP
jgi:crotonobetainyl-CoA:carnitine CoA-transferase CaiB-like acyl-CoA transferase